MDNNERKLHDAKLGAAVENAAGKLPEGYLIRVEIASLKSIPHYGEEIHPEGFDQMCACDTCLAAGAN